MSQFIIISGPLGSLDTCGLCIREVDRGSKELPDSAVESMPGLRSGDKVWYFEDEIVKSTDYVFVEAQKDLAEGKAFCKTRLSRVLSALIKTSKDIYLWYGDDWQDLPEVTEPEKFHEVVAHDLINGSGEIYLHFRGQHT